MHTRLGLIGILAVGFIALANSTLPTSQANLDPAPNAYGWNNSPVAVTITASGGAGLVVKYALNGSGPFSQTPPVTVTIPAEGTHTLEYWAQDATGEETPHNRLTVRIDFSPPKITIRLPEDKRYLLHEKAIVDWFAYDRLSGVAFTDALADPGDPLDTDSPGTQTFWVFARDRAGNTAREEVDYQVICLIETVLETGFFLDRILPPEERKPAGLLPLAASYVVGEEIVVAFRLKDVAGKIGPWTRPNLLVTQVQPDLEFGERHTIWNWLAIPYDAEAALYRLVYSTEEREPGIYDLWLSFGDGQSERIRIELLPSSLSHQGH